MDSRTFSVEDDAIKTVIHLPKNRFLWLCENETLIKECQRSIWLGKIENYTPKGLIPFKTAYHCEAGFSVMAAREAKSNVHVSHEATLGRKNN